MHAHYLAWAAWKLFNNVSYYYSWTWALLPESGLWGTPHTGVSISFPEGPRVSPGLCLQMAVAGLVQSHLFRRNLISPQAESLLPPPALSLALICRKMSSGSFPPGPEIQGEEFH